MALTLTSVARHGPDSLSILSVGSREPAELRALRSEGHPGGYSTPAGRLRFGYKPCRELFALPGGGLPRSDESKRRATRVEPSEQRGEA